MAGDFDGLAKALVIPQSVINNLDKIDKKINQIASDSEKMATHFTSAMTRMGGSTSDLLTKLERINSIVGTIGSANIGGLSNMSSNFSKTATEAEKAAENISKVATSVNKIKRADEIISPNSSVLAWQGLQKNIDILKAKQEGLTKITKEYETVMSRIQSGKGGFLAKGMKEQYLSAQKELESSNKLIESYRQKQQAIVKYQLEQRKVLENQKAIEAYELNRTSLPEQRKAEELKKLNEYYRELEKTSARTAAKAEKDEDRKAKAAEKSAERQAKAQAKLESKIRKANYGSYVTSVEGSLRTADKATTYTAREQAIKNLEAAMKKLNSTDKDYLQNLNKLSEAHRKLSQEQMKVKAYMGKMEQSQHSLMNTSEQLMRKLALVFSVSQITQYMKNIVRVTGEFELQNTALASILQNKEKADKLFGQITELAVKSPFTLKELTTYTKSLSAYSVEYEKLYDTTKMLADVSAGLGVDMQRLILAFGQVKAANFLRGTETRQFTEAGINMLSELAKYYTELEGRIVSVTEVQDRQFKRMISFQDVEQVFKRLTSEGGMFYQMQERQAETIAGQVSNLQDRIDLMLNSIGKENQGVIKTSIEIVSSLIDNYEAMGNVIQAVGASFVAYKVSLLLTNKQLINFAVTSGIVTKAGVKQLSVINLLRVGLLKLSTSVKTLAASMKAFAASNVYLLAITAIVSAIYEAIHWNDELNERLDEIANKSNETAASINKIADAYSNIAKNAKLTSEGGYSEETYKELYAQLSKLDEMLKDKGYTLPVRMEFVTPENIDEVFREGETILKMANEFAYEFGNSLAEELNATELWGIAGENLETDLKDLSDAYGKVNAEFKASLDILENEIASVSGKLNYSARKYYEELKSGRKEQETEYEWTMRRLKLIQTINKQSAVVTTGGYYKSQLSSARKLTELTDVRLDIMKAEKEAGRELDKVFDDIIKKYGGLDNLKKKFKENPLVIKTEIDKQFEQMQLDEQSKRFASFWASQRLQIPVEFTTTAEMPQFYNDFRDTVKALDETNVFEKDLPNMKNLLDLQGDLQKKYKENKEYLDVLNKSNTKNLDLTKQIAEQNKILSNSISSQDEKDAARLRIQNYQKQKEAIDSVRESEIKRVNQQQESIKNIAKAFNLAYMTENKKSGRKTTDDALRKLKEQISLIQKAGSKYESLLDSFSSEGAKLQVVEAFQDAFNNVGLSINMDFDTKGLIEKISSLSYGAVKGGKQAVDEALAELKSKLFIDIRAKGLEELREDLDTIFSGYQLSIELDKMGANKDIMSEIFGLDVLSLDEYKKKVDEKFLELANEQERILADSENRKVKIYTSTEEAVKSLGEKGVNSYKEIQKKVSQAQKEELNERMKAYVEYLKNSISKKAQLEIESQKEIAKIQNTQGLSDEAKNALISQNREQTLKAKAKLEWEGFKGSDVYLKLFEDLEYVSDVALSRMKEALDGIKASMGELEPDQLKAIQEAYKKIEEQVISRNPFAAMRDAMKEVRDLQKEGKTEDVLQQQLVSYDAQASSLRQQISDIETIIGLKQNAISLDTQDEDFLTRNNEYLNENIEALRTMVSLKKESLSEVQTNIGLTNDDLKSYEKARVSLSAMSSEIDTIKNLANNAFGSIKSVLEAIGVESDSTAMIFADMGMSMVDLIAQAVMFGMQLQLLTVAATALGVSINTALGPIGWAVMAIQGISTALTAIFKIHDNKREKEIKRQLKLVEKLEKSYEKLEQAIDDAYSIDTLNASKEQSIEELKAQNEAYEKAIAAEKAKKAKNVDKKKIKEWEQAQEDNLERIKELQEQITADLGGFGSEANVKSAAQEFADAWMEAFLETGDGLEALEDKWDEYIQNVIAKQLMMKGTEKYLKPVMDMLDGMLEDSTFTPEEQKVLQNKLDEVLPQLNEFWKSVVGSFDLSGLKETEGMSGLQQAITGVSEETAQALEALLSSIRFFTSDSNAVLHNIYNWLVNPPTESPLLQELRVQSSYLNSINSLLGSVIKTSQGKGKVLRIEMV